jgi:thiamine biosynthesis lipoprotein
MLADVVSTAAYLLGADRALGFVDDAELAALCVDDALAVTMNESMRGYLQ